MLTQEQFDHSRIQEIGYDENNGIHPIMPYQDPPPPQVPPHQNSSSLQQQEEVMESVVASRRRRKSKQKSLVDEIPIQHARESNQLRKQKKELII